MADAEDISAASLRFDFNKFLVVKDDCPDAVTTFDRAPGGHRCGLCCYRRFGSSCAAKEHRHPLIDDQ